MARWRNCGCARCWTHGLIGPAILITVGILFFLDQTTSWHFSIGRTWPVILIVWGVMKLLADSVSMHGHVDPWQTPPQMPSSQTPPPPPPPTGAPPAL
ncbi:MAG TPA: DUF5668 domain-containing protein [Candidatus Acidoferrales bacterium]|nr:DUF5668 domain-containing protein [Candidatus Acidoferrales bacterium]